MKHPSIAKAAFRIIGVFCLLLLTATVIAYMTGKFDISFIEREQPHTETDTQKETEEDTTYEIFIPGTKTDPETVAELPTPYRVGASIRSLYSYPVIDADKKMKYLISAMTDFQKLNEEKTDDGLIFGDGVSLYYSDIKTDLPGEFSYSDMKETVVVKVIEDDQLHTHFDIEEKNVARPAVDFQNGYLILENENGFSLCDLCGTILLEDYDPVMKKLTDKQTADGRPLFQGPKGQYYLFENGEFLKADRSEHEDFMEIFADLPTYYKGDGTTSVYFEDGKYGYLNADGAKLTDAIYVRAFAHREGLAIAYDAHSVNILDEKCETVSSFPYETDDVFLTEHEITVPATFGKEFYGLNYFDHGMTVFRARINLETYRVFTYQKISDDARVFDQNGKRLSQPKEYEMVGYADGLRLMKKIGEELYGYMDNSGNWVIDPAFSYAHPFYQGLAVVGYADGKKGLVDTSGKMVLPMAFDYVSDISHGCCAVYDTLSGWLIFRLGESGDIA